MVKINNLNNTNDNIAKCNTCGASLEFDFRDIYSGVRNNRYINCCRCGNLVILDNSNISNIIYGIIHSKMVKVKDLKEELSSYEEDDILSLEGSIKIGRLNKEAK